MTTDETLKGNDKMGTYACACDEGYSHRYSCRYSRSNKKGGHCIARDGYIDPLTDSDLTGIPHRPTDKEAKQ